MKFAGHIGVPGLALLAVCGVAAAQTGSSDTSQKDTQPPKSTAQKFPYPGESKDADVPAASVGSTTPPPGYENERPFVPDAPETPSAPAAANGKHTPPPYPGDPDAPQAPTPSSAGHKAPPAYPGDPDAGTPAAGSPSDGFSSSSSSSASDPGLTDVGSSGDEPAPDARRHPLKKKGPPAKVVTPASQESEDLDVADFYQQTGNFAGAYGRAKDAVTIMPDDPFAHLALADAARKLGKSEEAKAEYAQVLKLDPAPKQQKAAQRALAEMAGVRH